MLSERFSLYIINPRNFTILKNSSLAKSNLSLNLIIWINIIFIFSVFFQKVYLSLFLRVSSRTLFLLANFFITLLKNNKLCRSSSYNLWILSISVVIYNTNSSHFLISSKTSVLNLLFIKNGVLLIILYSEVFRLLGLY